MKLINLLAAQGGQGLKIGRHCTGCGLKAAHLCWTGRSAIDGSPTHNLPHYWILEQLFGVVNIRISRQSAKNALPK
jgi:hypothetical protein